MTLSKSHALSGPVFLPGCSLRELPAPWLSASLGPPLSCSPRRPGATPLQGAQVHPLHPPLGPWAGDLGDGLAGQSQAEAEARSSPGAGLRQVLYREKDSDPQPRVWPVEGNASLSVQLTGLGKYVLYEVQVLAFTRIGDGRPSRPPVLERTLDDGECPSLPPPLWGPPLFLGEAGRWGSPAPWEGVLITDCASVRTEGPHGQFGI